MLTWAKFDGERSLRALDFTSRGRSAYQMICMWILSAVSPDYSGLKIIQILLCKTSSRPAHERHYSG